MATLEKVQGELITTMNAQADDFTTKTIAFHSAADVAHLSMDWKSKLAQALEASFTLSCICDFQ